MYDSNFGPLQISPISPLFDVHIKMLVVILSLQPTATVHVHVMLRT